MKKTVTEFPIESSHATVNWHSVAAGEIETKVLELRNILPYPLVINLIVRDSADFSLNGADAKSQLKSIPARAKVQVGVSFAPSAVGQSKGKLVVKPQGVCNEKGNAFKATIGLNGWSGNSLRVEETLSESRIDCTIVRGPPSPPKLPMSRPPPQPKPLPPPPPAASAQVKQPRDQVYLDADEICFVPTRPGQKAESRVVVKNRTAAAVGFKCSILAAPFVTTRERFVVKPLSFVKVPVKYAPISAGAHVAVMELRSDGKNGICLRARLKGVCNN